MNRTTTQGHRSSAGFEHDFQKFCVEYWAEGNNYAVEKEARGEGDDRRPDVVLRLKKPNPKRYYRVYVEVQRDIHKDGWLKKKMQQYANDCFIVIRVENFEELHRSQAQGLIGELLDVETQKPPPIPEKNERYIMYKGHRIKERNKLRIDILENRKVRDRAMLKGEEL